MQTSTIKLTEIITILSIDYIVLTLDVNALLPAALNGFSAGAG
jgi:hypothetical protein